MFALPHAIFLSFRFQLAGISHFWPVIAANKKEDNADNDPKGIQTILKLVGNGKQWDGIFSSRLGAIVEPALLSPHKDGYILTTRSPDTCTRERLPQQISKSTYGQHERCRTIN